MTTPTKVRCGNRSISRTIVNTRNRIISMVAPPDLTSKKRCYYCDLYSGKYSKSFSDRNPQIRLRFGKKKETQKSPKQLVLCEK